MIIYCVYPAAFRMGNCLQASETDHVDLLHSDNESVSIGGRSPTDSAAAADRSRSESREMNVADRPARSSRRRSRQGSDNGEQVRRRGSTDRPVLARPSSMPPPTYEVSMLHRSSAPAGGESSSAGPVYHPSPGVSRQASELTEEEQIKIAQRIGLIQHLPVDIYAEGNKTDKECIICMVEFVDGDRCRFLPCMHTYHVDCIDEWLMRSFSCPSCLEPVDSALLTSYDQQQLAAFADADVENGSSGNGAACQSLPRQLEQLTAITSPSSSVVTPSSHGGS